MGGLAGGGPGLQHRVWVKEEAAAAQARAVGTDKLACQRKAGEGKTFTNPPGGESQRGCPCPGEQWVLDFSGSLMRQLMERVTEASPEQNTAMPLLLPPLLLLPMSWDQARGPASCLPVYGHC